MITKHTLKPGPTRTINTYAAFIAVVVGRLSLIGILVALVVWIVRDLL